MKIKFTDNTIVVFEGIITKFSVIRPFITQLDEVRIANQEEKRRYNAIHIR